MSERAVSCDEFQNLISARIDGELADESRIALDGHLAECRACRLFAQDAERLDGELRRAFADRRRATDAVAEQVVARLSGGRATSPRWLTVGLMALSAAAGFAGAIWLAPKPSRPPPISLPPPAPTVQATPGPTLAIASLGTLTLATGPIRILRPGSSEWALLATGQPIEPDSQLRTGPESRCEVQTNDGSELRLNADSEMKLASTRDVELRRGQAWSTVAHADRPFSVRVDETTAITALGTQFDVRRTLGETQLTVVDGATKVTAGSSETTVKAGEAMKIINGRLGEVHQVDDLVVATRWVHEILVLKGRDDPELGHRIDDLLAQIGETKVDYFYEQEVRALGDHCALPLTRFIQSDRSHKDENKRVRAAQILSDIAQPWCIPELIGLLTDTDGRVREFSAKALLRLTGQTHGRSPESWREQALATCEDTIGKWRKWWEENKHRYPGVP